MKTLNMLMIFGLSVLAAAAVFGGTTALAAGGCGGIRCPAEFSTGDGGASTVLMKYALWGGGDDYVTAVDRGQQCGGASTSGSADKGGAGDMGKTKTEDDSGIWIGHGRIAGHGGN